MSEGMPYADIVILALIAGFILLRLRNVLGQKPGADADFFKRLQPMVGSAEPVVRLAEKTKPRSKDEQDAYMASVTDAAVIEAVNEIKARDPLFNATRFVDGAKLAFEMVLDGYAKGDKPALKALLAEPVYQDLASGIDARAAEENRTETTLVAVTARDILKATLTGTMARISVRFISEQISIVRNKKGDIVEGNPSESRQVEDEWVFERDVTSKNPNWKIIEI